MTVTTPTVEYANFGNGSSTGYYAVGAWVAATVKTVGLFIRATAPSVNSERVFVCTVAGTTHATTQPTWSNTKGTKTTDNTVTWQECTGNPAMNGDLTNTPLSSQNRSGAQTLGNIITNNAQTFYFICTTAGTTGAGEPTYNTTTGLTTTDSGCTWTCLGAIGSFTAWNAPYARIGSMNGSITVPSVCYVSSSHAETVAATASLSLGGSGVTPPVSVVCIQNGGSIPPTGANVTTGATYTTTGGGSAINISGNIDFTGIAFTSAGSTSIGAWGPNSYIHMHNCSMVTVSDYLMSGNVELDNTTMNLGSARSIGFQMCNFVWRDTPSALSATSWPTALFFPSTQYFSVCLFEGLDLSAFAGTYFVSTTGANNGSRFVFSHCKLPSTLYQQNSSYGTNAGFYMDFINCDTSSATYKASRYTFGAAQTTSSTVVAAGGASDGTTSYSWQVTSVATFLAWVNPIECIPISIWNATTGSNVTITMQGAYVGTALPYNDNIWFDVLYFGTAGSVVTTRGTCSKANVATTATQWSSSATLWGAAASARGNSTVYALNAAIGVSSAGSIVRAFLCTTAGTSSGSLPGAYATSVDGSQVTDGTAVFTAVERFAMTLTLSAPQPQAAGYFVIYPKVGLASSTFFIDPSPTLS